MERKPVAQISGAVTSVDCKKRTLVITQHLDGGQRDKATEFSWQKQLKPKQGGKEVDWRAVRPGMLVTAKYTSGKERHSLTELNLAK
jgi:hypothetical protein